MKKNPNGFASYPIDCTGNLHVAAASFALNHFGKVEIVGCPANACINRLGQERLEQRFLQRRPPEAPAHMNFSKVQVFSGSLVHLDRLTWQVTGVKVSQSGIWWRRIRMLLATTFFLSVTAAFSALPYEKIVSQSMLRISIRLPGQAAEVCRERSAQEIAALPQHMRSTKECKRQGLDYSLEVSIDGKPVLTEKLNAAGARGDKPILFDADLPLAQGLHEVSVQLLPLQNGENQAFQGLLNFTDEFQSGRALLIYYDANSNTLVHSAKAVN